MMMTVTPANSQNQYIYKFQYISTASKNFTDRQFPGAAERIEKNPGAPKKNRDKQPKPSTENRTREQTRTWGVRVSNRPMTPFGARKA